MVRSSDDDENPVDDREFREMTQSPAEARMLRKALETLKGGGAGPVLQEFAQEVLSGRASLREAAASPAYGEALTESGEQFRQEWYAMSDAEREELAAQGRAHLESGAFDEDSPGGGPRPEEGRSSKPSAHDGRGWSLY